MYRAGDSRCYKSQDAGKGFLARFFMRGSALAAKGEQPPGGGLVDQPWE